LAGEEGKGSREPVIFMKKKTLEKIQLLCAGGRANQAIEITVVSESVNRLDGGMKIRWQNEGISRDVDENKRAEN
jgi:hypothetical protein